MILQLNPMIPLSTPLGEGFACLVIDYGQEHNLIWTVLLDSGQVWSFDNSEVRVIANRSVLRTAAWERKAAEGIAAEIKERGTINIKGVLESAKHYLYRYNNQGNGQDIITNLEYENLQNLLTEAIRNAPSP